VSRQYDWPIQTIAVIGLSRRRGRHGQFELWGSWDHPSGVEPISSRTRPSRKRGGGAQSRLPVGVGSHPYLFPYFAASSRRDDRGPGPRSGAIK
jgi:hypothetical protein